MISPRPTAIVFDAYGTLLDVEAVADACREADPDPYGFAAEWRRQQLAYTWLRNSMGRYADFRQVTADALDFVADRRGVRLGEDVRARLLDAWLLVPPFPEVRAALPGLAAMARLSILSNGTPAMLEAALGAAGLRGLFDDVLSVDSVALYKPDPRVYEFAVAELSVDAELLLFVSANGWDVAGATAAGLRAVFLNRTGLPEERLGQRAAAVVPDLGELLGLLEEPPATRAG